MRAFVPSHITGFFAAKRQENPAKSGSIGCGLCLSMGATTSVQAAEETEIQLNGKEEDAPVSRFVVEKMALSPVSVKTQLDMPLGAGFGASGAGALGAAYALNAYFDLGLTANAAAAVAHVAEVSHRTGLGDVIAQNSGGLVVRLMAGAPGLGIVDRIPVQPLKISYVVRGPISTREVLSDQKAMKGINRAGEAALKELLKMPTLKEFMHLSRRFTSQTGLASDWALDAIEAVEAAGGMASMIMLGDSVFAIGGGEALKEFGALGTTTISQRGANLD
jgi:pantoate kinase